MKATLKKNVIALYENGVPSALIVKASKLSLDEVEAYNLNQVLDSAIAEIIEKLTIFNNT